MPAGESPQPKESEAVAQARAKAQRLALSFQAVYGQPGPKRSEAQRSVLEHLAVCAGDDANSYRFNEAKDGVALIAAGIHRDGAKSILRVIERQLSIARAHKDPPKIKPQTKR